MAEVVYATREQVKAAMDAAETARNDAQVDRALSSGARNVEGLLKRRFYPQTATRFFPWPNRQYARPWRLWLDLDELISVTTLTAGGVVVAASDFFLEPANTGPPYTRIEIDLGSSAAFSSGATHQRAIQVAGVFGFSAEDDAAGTVAEALDATETGVDISNAALVGVGSIIKVDSERMLVVGRSALDTTQNTSALTASTADVAITGVTAGTIAIGEVLVIDSERMLVVDVVGTTLTVRRAWDGTTLAAHSNGTDIFALRTLTVERGALGTTAATHSNGAALTVHRVPSLIRDLNIAEAINQLQLESSAYARVIGEGETAREGTGRSLFDLRKLAMARYGRQARSRAV